MIRAALLASIVAAMAFATTATAADRMWIGFHDDPSFRWSETRQDELQLARNANATLVRILVEWHQVAQTKPANPSNSFDPAYTFQEIDDLIRNAQARGMEVILSLWGTPAWANGDAKPNVLPTNAADYGDFARAVASRYSGKRAGFPFVRFYGIWNESNISLFLSPQFSAAGKIVGPAAYAKLVKAAVPAIKAASSRAQVSIGETSSTGRDKPRGGTGSDSVAPATFARLLAPAVKGVKFDAWAQHPYPFPVNMKPSQKVRYPNVTLLSLPRFEKDLDTWFGRKNLPIWITEYGHETKPGEPLGVTEAVQAKYAAEAIGLAKADPRVQMFVWFVFRDSPGSVWQSGLYRTNGSARPAVKTWAAAALGVDAVNGKVTVKGGTKNPKVTVYLREYCANNGVGTAVGSTTRVWEGAKLVGITQPSAPLGIDCTIRIPAPVTVLKGKTYRVEVAANTKTTATITRTITLVGV
jgi:Cellulase (glycosyl hydrolase family 5)